MADNVDFQSSTLATPPDSLVVTANELADGSKAQGFHLLTSGATGPNDIVDATSANGLEVDVTRTPKGTTAFTDPTCDTTADLLLASNSSRKAAIIQNAGSVDCYIGPSGVTTSSGLFLQAGASFSDDVSTSAWYGITASGTADIRVCEVS